MGNYRMCVCFIRRFRVTEAGPPPDVKEAFRKHADGGTHMTAEQLRLFLVEVQGDGDGDGDAEKIVELVSQKRHHVTKFARHSFSLDDFYYHLFSADLNPPTRTQRQDQEMGCYKMISRRLIKSEMGFGFSFKSGL